MATFSEKFRPAYTAGQSKPEAVTKLEEMRENYPRSEEMAEIEHHRILPAEGDFHRCALTPRDGEDLRPRIAALARSRDWPLRELTRERHTLEEIFVQITKPKEDF